MFQFVPKLYFLFLTSSSFFTRDYEQRATNATDIFSFWSCFLLLVQNTPLMTNYQSYIVNKELEKPLIRVLFCIFFRYNGKKISTYKYLQWCVASVHHQRYLCDISFPDWLSHSTHGTWLAQAHKFHLYEFSPIVIVKMWTTLITIFKPQKAQF